MGNRQKLIGAIRCKKMKERMSEEGTTCVVNAVFFLSYLSMERKVL